jgi:hypothetical protein
MSHGYDFGLTNDGLQQNFEILRQGKALDINEVYASYYHLAKRIPRNSLKVHDIYEQSWGEYYDSRTHPQPLPDKSHLLAKGGLRDSTPIIGGGGGGIEGVEEEHTDEETGPRRSTRTRRRTSRWDLSPEAEAARRAEKKDAEAEESEAEEAGKGKAPGTATRQRDGDAASDDEAAPAPARPAPSAGRPHFPWKDHVEDAKQVQRWVEKDGLTASQIANKLKHLEGMSTKTVQNLISNNKWRRPKQDHDE